MKRTGEKIPQDPLVLIENYLDRFKGVLDEKDAVKRRLKVRALKKLAFDAHIIAPEDVPDSHFDLRARIARERGQPIEITEEMREEVVPVIQNDQRESLGQWIDYLASADAPYPIWAKYWAFRGVTSMSLYDSQKKQFRTRSRQTTARFPELNREALAHVVDLIDKRSRGETVPNPLQVGANDFAEEGKLVSDADFQRLLTTENFAKYYAFALEHLVADNSELFKETDGEWRYFEQGTDAHELTSTLQGHGTGWCIAGEWTAQDSLDSGGMWIYYSLNPLGVPSIPRLAIRLEDETIAEVRGVAHHQEIDQYIGPVLEKKLEEFGSEGDTYKKAAACMKRLTELERKFSEHEAFSADDVRFLYEAEAEIVGFGYTRDPRIRELRSARDAIADARLLLDAGDDNDFLLKFLRAAEQLVSNILGVELIRDMEVPEIDYEQYDPARRAFVERLLPRLQGLDAKAGEELCSEYYGDILATSPASFASAAREDLLELLLKYDREQDTGGEHSGVFVRDFFGGIDQSERLRFLEKVVAKGHFDILQQTIPQIGRIPPRFADILIKAGRVDVLAKGLSGFEAGLGLKVALKLIEDGYARELSDNLGLFRGLSARVWEELNGEGYFNDLERNRASFAPLASRR